MFVGVKVRVPKWDKVRRYEIVRTISGCELEVENWMMKLEANEQSHWSWSCYSNSRSLW
jgi:hypothetical protein